MYVQGVKVLCYTAEALGKSGIRKRKALTSGTICRLVYINNRVHLDGVDEAAEEVPSRSECCTSDLGWGQEVTL